MTTIQRQQENVKGMIEKIWIFWTRYMFTTGLKGEERFFRILIALFMLPVCLVATLVLCIVLVVLKIAGAIQNLFTKNKSGGGGYGY